MALTHAPSVYMHAFGNYSTPSFSSTSNSSHPDVNSLKHMFSSPLAECYVRDEILEQKPPFPTACHVKSTGNGKSQQKEPLESFNTPTEVNYINKAKPSNVLLEKKWQTPNSARQERSVPRDCHTTSKRDASRSLLSPISFTPPTDTSNADDLVPSRIQVQHITGPHRVDLPSTTESRRNAGDGNHCAFPHYAPSSMPIRDEVSTNKSANRRETTTKPRALSLGEGLRSGSPIGSRSHGWPHNGQTQKALHRTTGSRELRRSVGSVHVNRDCAPWVDQIIRATRCAGSYQPFHTFGNHGLSRRARPRLWLDDTRNEEKIEEAQITTVMHSPTKPKVITIARRGSAGSPNKDFSTCPDRPARYAESRPATPPETPQSAVGLEVRSSASPTNPGSWKECTINGRDQVPLTPPNSRLVTPRARSAVRRTSTLSNKALRVESISQVLCTDSTDNDAILWVIAELEAAIYNHPSARLYLDSPIIAHIRSSSDADTRQRATPETNLTGKSAAPHSRYSIFRPLSSHPVASQDAACYRGVQYQSPKYAKDHQNALSACQGSATLSALRVVFPQAPGALLDSLQATYLALNYVSSIPIPAPSQCHPSPASSGLSFSAIPRKALATLGIQAPKSSPAASTSWLRSETPDVKEGESSKDNSSIDQHKERLENLQVSLRISVRGLLGEIEGRRLGKRDESLVRAVAEVVRCGEGVAWMSRQASTGL